MAILSREYNCRYPADVRALLQADTRLQMMLSLIYQLNDCIVKWRYARDKLEEYEAAEQSEYMVHRLADQRRVVLGIENRKRFARDTLRAMCLELGLAGNRVMPGRYSGLRPRKGSSNTGYITGFTKESLFVFKDLFDHEALTAMRVNDAMFRSDEDE